MRRAWRALGAYLASDDPLVAASNTIAFLLACNLPLYPLTLWLVTGEHAMVTFLTALNAPVFLAVPFVSRRHPLAGRPERPVRCGQLRDAPAPAEERLHVALAARALTDLDHVGRDPPVRAEVAGDERLRLLPADPRARGEAEVAHPVRQPEVHHLRHRALVGGHLGGVLAQDARRRLPVDVHRSEEHTSELQSH